MAYPKQVRIVEVGPRDGLQNEKAPIATADKIELIQRLEKTGLKDIEITSFVSPKAIPQLADNADVANAIMGNAQKDIRYWALVPNQRGLEGAINAKIKHVAVFTAASETFNQRNINKSIAASFEAFGPVLETAKQQGLIVRGYVSTAFYCPYEGRIDKKAVGEVAQKLLEMGVDEISIGDTIGKATPEHTQDTVQHLLSIVPKDKLALHFHDTYGHALDNIQTCLNLGIDIYDSSIAGLGGCPYAPGASGNVATEAVVHLMQKLGIETGIDIIALEDTGRWVQETLQRCRLAASSG